MERVPTSNEKLLGAKGIATSSKDATRGAPGLTARNKKLRTERVHHLVFIDFF